MTDEEKKSIERIEKKILTEECKKVIRVPIYISDLKTILNLIQKQQAELEKKDKIIDLMERFIADLDIDKDICKHQVAEFCEGTDGVSLDICVKCINQYFEKKVEEDEYEK